MDVATHARDRWAKRVASRRESALEVCRAFRSVPHPSLRSNNFNETEAYAPHEKLVSPHFRFMFPLPFHIMIRQYIDKN